MKHRSLHPAAFGLLCLAGCALFDAGSRDLLPLSENRLAERSAAVDSDVPVRRIVRLDTTVVSALASDRRLRELVWEELDESGLMSPEDRRRLNQSGIRVGVSGGRPPWSLASLIRGDGAQSTSSDSAMPLSSANQSSSMSNRLAIAEGSETFIEMPHDGKSLIIPPGRIAGMYNGSDLQDARCVLQLTPTEYGAGWVVLRFLPQIRHGTMTARYSVSADGERMPTRQRIHPLYEQQFELKLHANETVVIGHQEQVDWTAGRLMFQSDTLAARNERLVVLQLKQIEEVKGERTITVDYQKH